MSDDIDHAAAILFGGSGPQEQRGTLEEALRTPCAPAEQPSADEQHKPGPGGAVSPAKAMFGRTSADQVVTATHADALLGSAFDGPLQELRAGGDHEAAQQLGTLRQTVGSAAVEFGLEPADLSALLQVPDYRAAASEEALVRQEETAIDWLERSEGDQAEAALRGAQRVAEEACARVPGLRDWLDRGAGNDPKLLAVAVRVARARGYIG